MMYKDSKFFSYLKLLSRVIIIVILVYLAFRYIQNDKIKQSIYIIIYLSLTFLYAFQVYIWLSENWPLKTKKNLARINGYVQSLEYRTKIIGSGKTRSKHHQYHFSLNSNKYKCFLDRQLKLKIENGDNVKVVGLYNQNNVLNIIAIKNNTKNTTGTDNLLNLSLLLFATLLLPITASAAIFQALNESSIIAYILIVLLNLILIPVVMIMSRTIDQTIEALAMLTFKKNNSIKYNLYERIKVNLINNLNFILKSLFSLKTKFVIAINASTKILKNKYFISFFVFCFISIFLYLFFTKPTYELGLTYFNDKKYIQAIDIWEQVSESNNNLSAQLKLASLYENNELIKKDYERALEWYLKAAENGNIEAQYKAAMIMDKKSEKKFDNSEITSWYLKAAINGHLLAQINLARFYRNKERKYAKAIEWYNKAIAQGSADATFQLAMLYEYDIKDNEKAIQWYLEALTHNNDYIQYSLARMYEYGRLVKQNLITALSLYKKSALQGYAEAQNKLGIIYQEGKWVQQNCSIALEWYQKSAEQDNPWYQINLGEMYISGECVERNYNTAMFWFKRANKLGNIFSKINIAKLYESKNDYGNAFKWYKEAANAKGDYSEAKFKLAQFYEQGKSVELNYLKANEWYRKAAQDGYTLAEYQLGELYYHGKGVKQNFKDALYWYERTISLLDHDPTRPGTAKALYRLGLMNELGQGTTKDTVQALQWYKQAAKLGNINAKNKLKSLTSITGIDNQQL